MAIPSQACSARASAAAYVPRRPHETVLYGIVREHLATFLMPEGPQVALGGPCACVSVTTGCRAWEGSVRARQER